MFEGPFRAPQTLAFFPYLGVTSWSPPPPYTHGDEMTASKWDRVHLFVANILRAAQSETIVAEPVGAGAGVKVRLRLLA